MMLLKDQLTAHFRLDEFVNHEDGNAMEISPDFIFFVWFILEPFRVWYNRAINITSGYRTKAFNKKVKGVSNSLHLKALAVDFLLPSVFFTYSKNRQEEFLSNMTRKWNEVCKSVGWFGQVCWYDNRVHMGASKNREYFEDKRGK